MRKNILIFTAVIILSIITSSTFAAPPQIQPGLTWLNSSQTTTGNWPQVVTSEYHSTAAALDAAFALEPTSSTYTTGLAWLGSQVVSPTDYLSRRIIALKRAGQDVTSEVNSLFLYRNAGGGWGGDAEYQNDIIDTALALQALKAANYSDSSVLFQALNFLALNQNADGGFGLASGSDSNAYVTAVTLRTLSNFALQFDVKAPVQKAGAYLLTKQNADGGFGSSPSTVYETALSLLSLLETGQGTSAGLLNAINYLTTTQAVNGSWNDDPYSTALALQALANVKPNLAIASGDITFSEIEPGAGSPITIHAAVHNTGTELAANVLVHMYEGDPLNGGIQIAATVVPLINPGGTSTIDTTYTPAGTIDRRAIYVIVDPLNTITELNETDNSAVNYITLFTPADIFIDSTETTFSPTIPTVDVPLTLTFTVRNTGEKTLTNIPVRLYKDMPNNNGVVVNTYSIPTLQGHGFYKLTATINTPTAGLNTFYLVADPDNLIQEIDETNNIANITVKVENAKPVDLSVNFSRIFFSFPNGFNPGSSMAVRAVINNAGSTNVQAVVRFYQGDPTAGGVPLGNVAVPVPAMDRALAEVNCLVPAGNPTIYVVVDPDNLVPETDKTNNIASRAFEPSDQVPDLTIESNNIFYYPAHPTPRSILTIEATAVNRGGYKDAFYGTDLRMDLYDGAPEQGGVLKGSFQFGDGYSGIGQLGTRTGKITLSNLSLGEHEFYVIVDPTNTVPEISESNNRASIKVVVAQQGENDLSITSKDIKFSPEFPVAGDKVILYATVHNSSGETVYPYVSFYSGNPATGGTLLSKVSMGINQESSATVSFYQPYQGFTMTNGIPEIYVVVDPDNTIQETNESNNIASRTIDTYKKDLFIKSSDISLTPLAPQKGDMTTAAVIVHSTGQTDLSGTLLLYEGTPEHGNLIGSQQVTVVSRMTTTASFPSYSFPGGAVTLTAVIENVTPAEDDVTNNRASAKFGEQIDEGRTNEGTDFWLAWPPVYYNTAKILIQSSNVAHVTVTIPTPSYVGMPRIWKGTVAPGAPATIPLSGFNELTLSGYGGFIENKGIHIESDADVSVVFHVPDGSGMADDSYLSLPTHMLGTRYYILSYPDPGAMSYSIVATSDNTHVDIGGTVIQLDQGQTYVYNSKDDLTGAYLRSDKPIAVIASDYCTTVTRDPQNLWCDTLLEQMLPISLLGTDYFTAPLYSPGGGDIFRILAVEDGTQVRLQDVYRYRDISLNAGQYQEFEQEAALHITSNKPVMIAQYAKGGSPSAGVPNDAHVGDPFQMTIIPTDKLKTEYRFISHPGYGGKNREYPAYQQGSYITVVAPEPGTIAQFDGAVITEGWQVLPDKGNYIVLEVNEGEHVVTADKPVGVYVHGYRDYGAYGYPAGLGIPLGNVAVGSLTASPSSPTEGQLAVITATVTNTGNRAIKDVIVRMYNGDPNNGGTQIGQEQYYPTLYPREAKTITANWDTYGYKGTNKIYVVADPLNALRESDKTDNIAMLTIDVGTPGKPDLVITDADISFSKDTVVEGESLTIATKIKNRGAQTGNVSINLYLGDPNNGGKLLQNSIIGTLLPFYGETQLNFAVTSTGFPSTADLYITIDPDRVIDELDKTNNTAHKRLIVNRKKITLAASTDKASYTAQSEVGVSLSVMNENVTTWSGSGNIVVENVMKEQIAQVVTFTLADIKPLGIGGLGYRIPVTVTEPTDVVNAVALIQADFNTVFATLGITGRTVDKNSIRVIEFNNTGSNASEKQAKAVFETDTSAKITWLMDGRTILNTPRHFAIYFDTTDKGPKLPADKINVPVSGRLIAYSDNRGYVYVIEQRSDASFSAPRTIDDVSSSNADYTQGIILDDFNNDGFIDIITGSSSAGMLYYYQNRADGSNTFLPKATIGTMTAGGIVYSITSGDFNKDGSKDFIVSINASPLYLYIGNGNGTFTRTELPALPYYSVFTNKVVADIDNDGIGDLLVGDGLGYIHLYKGNGDGSLLFPQKITTTSIGSLINGLAAGDFDGDGKIDLIVNRRYNGETYYLKGNGDGTFGVPMQTTAFGASVIKTLAAADVNGDGKLDVIVNQSYNLLYYPGNGDGTFGTAITLATGFYESYGLSTYLSSIEVHPSLGLPEAVPSSAFAFIWNTGNTFAGNYRIRVTLSDQIGIVAESAVPFQILPDISVNPRITTDKVFYNPHETATLSSTVNSLSRNAVLEKLNASVAIAGPGGQGTVYTETKAINTLMPNAAYSFKTYWNTGTYAAGSYPVTLEVRDAANNLISTATNTITISSTVRPSQQLRGAISVDHQSIMTGETVTTSYSVTNVGNIDLASVDLKVLTINTNNLQVYNTIASQATLTMGTSYQAANPITALNYPAKDYLVVLRATIGGIEETLAGTYLRVEGAPTAPSLLSPAMGSDVDTLIPALVVNNAQDPNDDKLTYEFELYADAGLTQLLASSGLISQTTSTTSWQVSQNLTENSTYYWRSRAYDTKLYGPWMETAAFRVNTINDPPSAPILSSPENNGIVSSLTPTLVVINATDPDSASLTYNFDLALDANFTQIVAQITGVTSQGSGVTSWQTPGPLTENTTYYWRAQADDWLIEGPWSTTGSFFVNTANDAPSIPVITAPTNGASVNALEADIIVQNSTDPDSPSLTYSFELDTVMSFDTATIMRSGNIQQGTNATFWHVTGLTEDTQYYVRAKASDGQAESNWSAITGFFINTTNSAPTAPTLVNPGNNAAVNVFTPSLSVNNAIDPDRDALTYTFEVYADAGLTSLVTATTGAGVMGQGSGVTTWTVPVTLTENSVYYWRTRANDGNLNSPWMTTAAFFVNTANDAPGAPVLQSPTDQSTVTTLTPTLVITNATDPDNDALTYEFEVYGSDAQLVAAGSGVMGQGSGTTSWAVSTALTNNTVYTWRVRAYDGDRYGPWTAMATFTVHLTQTGITVDIDFEPETLNKKDHGRWVLVKINLPHGYHAKDVDISSIRLEGTVHAELWPHTYYHHHHKHGCHHDRHGHHHEVLMVKFKRSEVIAVLPEGKHVPVHVTGTINATPFEGVDIIRVINKGHDCGGH